MTYEDINHPTPPAPDRPKLQRRWEFDDPAAVASRMRWRRRIGTAAVLTAAGLIVWGWLQSTAVDRMRGRAYATAVEADLTRLRDIQVAYHESQSRYATLEDLGPRFISSQGVGLRILGADSAGWHATAWHLQRRFTCTISGGVGPGALPDLTPGVPDCR